MRLILSTLLGLKRPKTVVENSAFHSNCGICGKHAEKYFFKLQDVIPYSWLLDPTPLPQHAVIPRLEIHDWREASRFSHKDRDLLLKVSGFSPLGWGSRGVTLGADLPHAEWEKRVDHALSTFESSPTIMQKFHKGRLFEHPYWEDGGSAAPSDDANKNAASPPNSNIELAVGRIRPVAENLVLAALTFRLLFSLTR